MTAIQTVDAETLERLAFEHPGTTITRHWHNGTEVRELIVQGAVYEARIEAAS